MEIPVKVQYSRPLISIQDIVNFIDKGEKYIKTGFENLSEQEQFEVLHGIILSPDYQRQYRSKPQEETSIIESIILGIPIPEIFLVRSSNKGIQLRHVMDGQHRLTAIYRYIKDEFALTNLEILKEHEDFHNKKFSQLSRENKIKILGSHLSILEFEAFKEEGIEIELFKRYNRNTKPLEKHEISMASFYSQTSQFITNFLNNNMEKAQKNEQLSEQIVKIYNITKDRKDKQKNHQEICIIFSIINNGPNMVLRDGVEIANKYLEYRSKLYKDDGENDLKLIIDNFDKFNEFILTLSKKVEYPFSTSICRDDEKRTVKYHTGVSMVLAIIFYFFDIDLENPNLLRDVQTIVKDSPLGDVTYNASSTNMRNLLTYIFKRNRTFNKDFSSLRYKNNLSEEIINILEIKNI
ncbi:MAG: DUF262 domain-containing protein [Clostridium sp.]|uniref:DUF262 domain-containing protein n=1 Tax=Clostridium sp. TaxID=1506 RepID=UPI0029025388|nr:DUF262 domain-containing protein [Clostridium sp.]MDU2459776.1 DUF262 domain-containing protein [Clostridium sp.]